MKTRITSMLMGFVVVAALCRGATGQIVLETDTLRLEIREDGMLQSLASKPDGSQYVRTAELEPVVVVYRGGRSVPESTGKYAVTGRWVYRGGESFPATRASLSGGKLTIRFAGANAVATFRVIATHDYLAFELLALEGDTVDRIDLFRLRMKKLPHLGEWVNVAYDDRFGVCLCAGNIETNVEMERGADHVLMRATAEKEVGFQGATAVLFGCRDPRPRFPVPMPAGQRESRLPGAAPPRRRPEQRYSYLWASDLTPDNVGEYVKWAKRGGFRMILFSYTAFARGAGHLRWNARYPYGMADLKKVTDAIRSAGLNAGMHLHYSKTHKSDPYVTPVPDARLHQVRSFTLAADVSADAGVLPVAENPEGCTLDEGRRLLKAGSELIAYESYDTDSGYHFVGCRRGHLKTSPSVHLRGESLGLVNVDTRPAFIRFDQNTDIQDEAARRIADIFRQTGPYQMVYFDGAEDVHEPFWHHVASAQYRVFRLLEPRPPVCEAAHYTHFSWHMITRSNAYDIVASADGMKDFCRLMPCPTAAARAKDFSRIEFGWLGRFGKTANGYAGPDVWEYVISRAAAWDCPISLKIGLKEITTNPRWADCFDVIKTWEDARLGDHLTDAHRDRLKNVDPENARYVSCFEQRGIWKSFLANRDLTKSQRAILANRQEHHLFINEQGQHELVPIDEIPNVADGRIRAYSFRRSTPSNDTYILAWAVDDEVNLRLPVPAGQLSVMRAFGKPLLLEEGGGEATARIAG
ncbi:MAG: hypothetical protein ACC628_24340, partial [Pirellulaceae bacterium]